MYRLGFLISSLRTQQVGVVKCGLGDKVSSQLRFGLCNFLVWAVGFLLVFLDDIGGFCVLII